jgi:hypothetical protein
MHTLALTEPEDELDDVARDTDDTGMLSSLSFDAYMAEVDVDAVEEVGSSPEGPPVMT